MSLAEFWAAARTSAPCGPLTTWGLAVLPSTSGVRSRPVPAPQTSLHRCLEPWVGQLDGWWAGAYPEQDKMPASAHRVVGAPRIALQASSHPPTPKGSCSLLSTPYCGESSRHEWATRFLIPTSYTSPGTEDALCRLPLGAVWRMSPRKLQSAPGAQQHSSLPARAPPPGVHGAAPHTGGRGRGQGGPTHTLLLPPSGTPAPGPAPNLSRNDTPTSWRGR